MFQTIIFGIYVKFRGVAPIDFLMNFGPKVLKHESSMHVFIVFQNCLNLGTWRWALIFQFPIYLELTRGLVTWYISNWELGSKSIENWKMRGGWWNKNDQFFFNSLSAGFLLVIILPSLSLNSEHKWWFQRFVLFWLLFEGNSKLTIP